MNIRSLVTMAGAGAALLGLLTSTATAEAAPAGWPGAISVFYSHGGSTTDVTAIASPVGFGTTIQQDWAYVAGLGGLACTQIEAAVEAQTSVHRWNQCDLAPSGTLSETLHDNLLFLSYVLPGNQISFDVNPGAVASIIAGHPTMNATFDITINLDVSITPMLYPLSPDSIAISLVSARAHESNAYFSSDNTFVTGTELAAADQSMNAQSQNMSALVSDSVSTDNTTLLTETKALAAAAPIGSSRLIEVGSAIDPVTDHFDLTLTQQDPPPAPTACSALSQSGQTWVTCSLSQGDAGTDLQLQQLQGSQWAQVGGATQASSTRAQLSVLGGCPSTTGNCYGNFRVCAVNEWGALCGAVFTPVQESPPVNSSGDTGRGGTTGSLKSGIGAGAPGTPCGKVCYQVYTKQTGPSTPTYQH